MNRLFYFSVLLWIVFEILNVYFIMPMPGSQQINSVDIAYFLYSFRWYFRVFLILVIIFSLTKSYSLPRKWMKIIFLLFALFICYVFNFVMVADKMFLQPSQLILAGVKNSTIPLEQQIIGITYKNTSKAYPLEFLAYHHQIIDSIEEKKFMITYCSVCRTGRVFEPVVDNSIETFRLVGMDHFNAMFEDKSTGSWWRQANGECIAGPQKGKFLPEFGSVQMTLENWLKIYPDSKIMQADPGSMKYYDSDLKFEKGNSESDLTGTDVRSWQNKSWIVGIEIDDSAKAYDWNKLKSERIINDDFNGKRVAIVLASDNYSFSAFQLKSNQTLSWRNDSLYDGAKYYSFAGFSPDDAPLKRIQVYQEFWHSWLSFHPKTAVYK